MRFPYQLIILALTVAISNGESAEVNFAENLNLNPQQISAGDDCEISIEVVTDSDTFDWEIKDILGKIKDGGDQSEFVKSVGKQEFKKIWSCGDLIYGVYHVQVSTGKEDLYRQLQLFNPSNSSE